jgi:phosphatidate cytidylyltransferase
MIIRVITALVGLPILFTIIWLGNPLFSVVLVAIAAIGAWEFCQIAKRADKKPMTRFATIWSALFVVASYILTTNSAGVNHIVFMALNVMIATSGIIISGLYVTIYHPHGTKLRNWITTISASIYTGGLISYSVMILNLDHGREWICVLILAVFANDTLAFLTGRYFGKTPLAPNTSPGKTIEGAVGGIFGALLTSLATITIFDLETHPLGGITLGILIGITAQGGDLLESKIKRHFDVKDSGWIIPGHGGILDRLDSIVFNLVLVYYFILWATQ